MNTNRENADYDAEQLLLAQRLREAREYLGLSQEQVAERLDIPRPAVSAIETGKRRVSSIELKQFSQLYKRKVEYFIGENEEVQAQDDLLGALFRATRPLSDADQEQVLKFAEFLRNAGKPPMSSDK